MTESRGSKVLEIHDLCVSFGVVTAVDHLNLDVAQGVLVGLIGSNGAGKTTALDAVTGFVPATGSARFEGHEVLGMRAHHRARLGMVRTWQAVQLFEDMTVRENLLVAAEAPGAIELLTAAIKRTVRKASHVRVEQVASEFDLSDALDRKPSELSLGQRKLVGLARGIVASPTLLLADEPAAGLSTAESVRLGQQLRRLVDNGLSMVLVDHDMGLVLGVCDYLYVLDHGKLIAEGTPREVRADASVIASYLGAVPTTDGPALNGAAS
jgi:branched-chain amino acid transport system ATP-binding protein